MPRFEPFRALRYAADQPLDRVAAPPYDVIDERDVDRLLAGDPHNIVAIDVPSASDGDARYVRAAERLQQWIDDAVLVLDDEPSFTLYRMRFADETGRARETVGVLGALEVVDEGAGGVLPHERTTPKAKTDRLDLTVATRSNLSPVWGLSLAAGLTELLEAPGTALGSCVDEDGVTHVVERVDAPDRVAAISAAVGSASVLIADGHHRYAISRTYRDLRRSETGRADGAAELTLTYVGELVEDQLSVAAIHRLITGVSAGELVEALATSFETSPAGEVGPHTAVDVVDQGALCVVHPDGQGSYLVPRPESFVGVRDIDSAKIEHALQAVPDATVTYQHGVANVVEAVTSGRASAGIIIRPVSIAEIRRTADEGLLMPPKSTFFAPKLRTGLVIRALGE